MKYLIAIFTFLSPIFAQASELVNVRLLESNIRSKGAWVDLSITNVSEKKICINARVIGLDGVVGEQVLFSKRNGPPFRFSGISFIRDENDSPSGVTIDPNQRVVIALDLSKDYEFMPGFEYELHYEFTSIGYCHGQGQMINLLSKPTKIRIK